MYLCHCALPRLYPQALRLKCYLPQTQREALSSSSHIKDVIEILKQLSLYYLCWGLVYNTTVTDSTIQYSHSHGGVTVATADHLLWLATMDS